MSSRVPILFPGLVDLEQCSASSELVSQHEGEVFVCNPDTSRVLIFHHRELHPDKQLLVQELMLSLIPTFTVSRIQVSPGGQKLLLWGERGVAVAEIPKRRRVKGATTCRCSLIGGRFFAGHGSVSAVEVQWFPGSTLPAAGSPDSHVVVLTSDNILRLYSTREGEVALWSYPLFNTASLLPYLQCLNVSTGPSLLSAQSGTMVGFSFGLERGEKVPVYVLEDNSDIFLVEMSLIPHYCSACVSGPLRVLPPDNENYELDACSILCLGSSPPVLAVASLAGSLQHFALLPEEGQEGGVESLYLLETVELDLPEPPQDSSSEGGQEEERLVLCADPTARDRYFVRGSTGLYSVFLPAVQRLERFLGAEEGQCSLDCECTVEHLLSVQPVQTGDPTCLLGSAVVLDPLLGAHLLLLISNAEFISLPLRCVHREAIALLSGQASAGGYSSPLKGLHSQQFSHRVHSILSRTCSNPLLRSGSSAGLCQKTLLELLLKSSQVFREQYIAKQSKARGEILHHMTLLQEQHTQQKTDLVELEMAGTNLVGEAESLRDRSNTISKRHQILQQRVSQLTRQVQCLLPSLCPAEEELRQELTEMSSSVKSLRSDANQLQEKLKYQSKVTRESPSLSSDQRDRVRSILQENDGKINCLVTKIKTANVQLT